MDIGIYERSPGVIDLPTEPNRTDRLVLVMARDNALPRGKRVTSEDVLGCELIVLGESSAISIGLKRLAEAAGGVLRVREGASGARQQLRSGFTKIVDGLILAQLSVRP
ncbi:hypothetical protein [Cupriavidus sp. CP313]